MADDLKNKAFEAVELAKKSGKIKKGANEATKMLERGTAKLVVYAKDVTPAEITMHFPLLGKDKGIPCVQVDSKEELGAAAGLSVSTAAVAVLKEGEAKKLIDEIKKSTGADAKPKAEEKAAPAKEEKKEEAKAEEKPEEKAEEKPEEAKPEAEEKKE